MINAIVSYKKSVVIFALYELGFFDCIQKNGYFCLTFCEVYGWDEDICKLLCIYLVGEKILNECNGKWYLNSDVVKKVDYLRTICEHEKNVYYNWITPESIVDVVKKGNGERRFDHVGFTDDERTVYEETMNGSNLNIIIISMLRKIKKNCGKGMDILEYGRYNNKISNILERHLEQFNITSLSFCDSLPENKKYNLILIYNSIHYKKTWKNIFKNMLEMLKDNGVLCVIDMFYNINSDFSSSILIDWITHGGIYNIYSENVYNELIQAGFREVLKLKLTLVETEIVYAYK